MNFQPKRYCGSITRSVMDKNIFWWLHLLSFNGKVICGLRITERNKEKGRIISFNE